MLPADSLASLLVFAPAVDAALKARFEPILATVAQRDAVDLTGARIEVQFTQGAWNGHWHVTPSGRMVHAVWSYNLRINVFTTRAADQLARHGEQCGRMREALAAAFEDPALLPFHSLASMDEQNATEQIAVGDEQDVSSLGYTGLVAVKAGAWPASS